MYRKLSRWLEHLSFKLRSWSLYLELKYYYTMKTSYIRKLHRHERGIGKTYSLVKLATKYDLPIFVGKNSSRYYIHGMAKEVFKKDIKVIVADDNTIGKRFKIALVEEGIKPDELFNIVQPSAECIIGYQSIDY